MSIFQFTSFSQCGINKTQVLKENCKGIYLHDKVVKGTNDGNMSLVLTEGENYSFYLLNSKGLMPDFYVYDVNKNPISLESVAINENIVYYFTPQKTGKYDLKFGFKNEQKTCCLFAIYLNSRKVD